VNCLFLFGVHGLLEGDAELLAYGLELLEVLLVLALVLDLEFDTWGFCQKPVVMKAQI
jgi:hypothetical protein